MKKIVQDVLPPNERSIRRIPLSDRQKKNIFPSEKQNKDIPPKKRGRGLKYLWIGLGIIFILILIKLFGFAEAEITINPRQQISDIDEVFTASKDPNKSTAEGVVSFETFTITEKLDRTAEATGEEHVERKASGEIVIFNTHSASSQTLVQNTRFETPEGLIFRTNSPVTVPGTTERNGETIPGQIRIEVFADEAGEEYNIGLTDFTIPGFEGLPQFENFFARSATEMSGGFSGLEKTIDSGNLETVRREMQSALEPTLRERIISEVPENFLLLNDTLEISFENSVEENGGDMVIIRETGKAQILILNKNDLQSSISEEILGSQENIQVINLEDLQITLIDNIESVNNTSSFQFNLSGEARLVWIIDEESIKSELAGQPRKDLNSLLSQYPSISAARASTKPFWKRSFPDEESRIYVEIEL